MIPEKEREALMRLTMCARLECGMCKYKDACDFDFQYELATKNMNILADALRKTEPTISKMEQVDKDINVRSKDEPQTEPLPKAINGVKIADAVAWADKWLEDNHVSEMWDMIRTLRDATEWQDEPQGGRKVTIGEPFTHVITEDRDTQVLDGWQVKPKTSTTAKDEPQIDEIFEIVRENYHKVNADYIKEQIKIAGQFIDKPQTERSE